jgi:ABC-type branched-subunit amino acid transport system ATPase component
VSAESNARELSGVLTVDELSVSFGGVRALLNVRLAIVPSESVAVIGPNGAGKSTLLNVISGFVKPNSGSIELDGQSIANRRPHQRTRLGIGRTFQTPRLAPGLTVRQTIEVSRRQASRRASPTSDIIAVTRCGDVVDRATDRLSLFERRLGELARAVACQPRVLLLDEPATGLRRPEVDSLGDVLEDVRSTFDCALVVVSHDMHLVDRLCSRVVVVDFGTVMTQGTPSAVRTDPRVIASYFGTVAS